MQIRSRGRGRGRVELGFRGNGRDHLGRTITPVYADNDVYPSPIPLPLLLKSKI